MSGPPGFALRVLVALGILFLVFRSLDVGDFRAVMAAPRWLPLIGMVVTAFGFMLLGGVAVWVLIIPQTRIALGRFLRYHVVATGLGVLTPAAVGDFSLVGLLRREHIPAHESLSAMLVNRGILFLLYGVVYLPLTLVLVLGSREFLWVPAAMGLAGAALFAVNLHPGSRRRLRDLLRRFSPRVEGFSRATSDLLRAYPGHLALCIAIIVVRSAIAGVVIELALSAAGTTAPLWLVILITNSLTLVNLLPVSVGGAGVYEGGGVILFGHLGLDSERVFAALLFQRAYMIVSSLIFLGLARWVARPEPLPRVAVSEGPL
jgi:uncharacterized membrane protein YbhN (UPF0104 family)